eukprot:CAMPEP_0170617314 /NCGR_PEP_ID=MMETSP0224-20130122/26349_1 /TAXON_ID=285029 /ORGANISM="Togula jolla, Strain CCCM 725" /LENGTH=187 /DNA_ID=CAMNT_0010943193 /DNA_START=64 /DNA_END=627 /DNA_ORIENTATION=-
MSDGSQIPSATMKYDYSTRRTEGFGVQVKGRGTGTATIRMQPGNITATMAEAGRVPGKDLAVKMSLGLPWCTPGSWCGSLRSLRQLLGQGITTLLEREPINVDTFHAHSLFCMAEFEFLYDVAGLCFELSRAVVHGIHFAVLFLHSGLQALLRRCRKLLRTIKGGRRSRVASGAVSGYPYGNTAGQC